jgi:heat shock protein HslJ
MRKAWMMRHDAIMGLAAFLTACGSGDDRLTDEQVGAEQNAPADAPVPIDQPPPPAAAQTAGSGEYKAVGTEPGWALTIRAGRMEYLGDYGEVRIAEPAPLGFRPAPGRYASGRLAMTIAPGPCSDGMSDLVYRQTVRLVADGKAVSGCGGGTVTPAGLAGTDWTVVSINGRRTGGGANYYLQFTDTMLNAKFGCNAMGGKYALNGDHLSVPSIEQNAMGCADPAGAFEAQGSAILRSNVRVERTSGERIRLVSEAGTIDLDRRI